MIIADMTAIRVLMTASLGLQNGLKARRNRKMARKKKEKEKSNFTSWEQVGNALCEITQINTR